MQAPQKQDSLSFNHASISYAGKTILKNINWELKTGEHWAIIGDSGSGKSSLLNAIIGKFPVVGGDIVHHYYSNYKQNHAINDPYFSYKNLIALVSHQHQLKNKYNLGELYYQQRFNSADAEEALSVSDFLAGQEQKGNWTIQRVIEELHLGDLLEKSLIKLSNGETRRLMFASALLQQPQLLLLDAPFTGLDVETRPYFKDLINRLADTDLTIIMVTSAHEIPECITHIARLFGGNLADIWTREAFTRSPFAQTAELSSQRTVLLPETPKLHPADWDFEIAVQLKEVNIHYGETHILNDLNWKIKKGECWSLSGSNGAGKSTLLSLITADNPQGYANDLTLFDQKRGSGESIWDIKRKIGFVSPELHQYFKTVDTCLQVVLSGLFDTMGLIKNVSEAQEQLALQWLQVFGIDKHATERFNRTALSVQRLTLLARALIKNPPLLVLDEPCQGMDEHQISHIRQVIDQFCRQNNSTLIYVSHYKDEIPLCVDQSIRLENGRVIERR